MMEPAMTKSWLRSLLGTMAACMGLLGAHSSSWSQTALDAEAKKSFDEAVKVIPGLSPDLVAGAQKEGNLTIYRLGYDFQGVVFPEFRKLFPYIKIVDFEATVGPLLQRYGAEARSGRNIADVVMNSIPGLVETMDKEGLVAHYTPTSASSYTSGQLDGASIIRLIASCCCAMPTTAISSPKSRRPFSRHGRGIVGCPLARQGRRHRRLGTGGVSALAYYFVDEAKFTDFETLPGQAGSVGHDQRTFAGRAPFRGRDRGGLFCQRRQSASPQGRRRADPLEMSQSWPSAKRFPVHRGESTASERRKAVGRVHPQHGRTEAGR